MEKKEEEFKAKIKEIPYNYNESEGIIECLYCGNKEHRHIHLDGLEDDGFENYLCPKCDKTLIIQARLFLTTIEYFRKTCTQ